MAAIFCYHELYEIGHSDIYYQDIFNFTARHRAYHESVDAGILHPADVIRQGDGLTIEHAEELSRIQEIHHTLPGTYILAIKVVDGESSGGHALALTSRGGRWLFLDPNYGLFECNNGIDEFIAFLTLEYTIKNATLIAISKGSLFPINNKVIPRFWNNNRDIEPIQPPVPAPRKNSTFPVPKPRRKLPDC